MTTNTYPINTKFPNGLNLNLLIREMHVVWPADLQPAEFTVHGGGRPGGTGFITGTLTIETPRALTAQENTDAEVHFFVHVGSDLPTGTVLATLQPPGQGPVGRAVYVEDAAKAGNGPTGNGTMLYTDGTNWRRFSDDEVIA